MRVSVLAGLLVTGLASAASWSFEDATIQAQERGSEAGAKQKFSVDRPISEAITLRPTSFLRLALTVTNGGKPRRAHQAFVTITNPDSQLQESFPLNINENGKAKLDIKYTDLPSALLSSKHPLQASIVIGSFGSSKPLKANAFSFSATSDPNAAKTALGPRYSALPEIHHIFREDPRSPAKVITLVFTLAVVACLPILLGAWAGLGANLKHLSKAFGAAPVSHSLFFGSIVAMEFVFWQYYTSWRLFTMLPVAGVVGLVAFLSGSGALTEVQERRLKGER